MQLVLLDHGLYKQLPDDFRLDYAGLWRALILADEPEIRRHCVAMNAGGAVQLFTMMLTQRPWEQVWGNAWKGVGRGARLGVSAVGMVSLICWLGDCWVRCGADIGSSKGRRYGCAGMSPH